MLKSSHKELKKIGQIMESGSGQQLSICKKKGTYC